ncbi:N-acetylmuramoyl-L-alanine amidase, partial [Candidatus Latescibacterota bacterium]
MTMLLRYARIPILLWTVFLTCISSVFPVKEVVSSELSSLSIVTLDKVPYVSMVEIAETFNLRIEGNSVLNTMSISRGKDTLNIGNLSRFVRFNSATENLMIPVKLFRGSLYAPAETTMPIISRMLPGTLEWNDRKHAVVSSEVTGSVASIGFEERQQGSLIRIRFNEPLTCTDTLIEGNGSKRLVISAHDCVYVPGTLKISKPAGLVMSATTKAYNGEMSISFLVTDEMETYDITSNTSENELLISLRRRRADEALATASNMDTLPVKNPLKLFANESIWVIDTVIVDPGHGGKDPGAVGPKKTKEKDIVLDIAKELKKIADKRGEIKIVLTRSKDNFVSLRNRAKIAREANGKLFISIHVNALKNRRVSGLET